MNPRQKKAQPKRKQKQTKPKHEGHDQTHHAPCCHGRRGRDRARQQTGAGCAARRSVAVRLCVCVCPCVWEAYPPYPPKWEGRGNRLFPILLPLGAVALVVTPHIMCYATTPLWPLYFSKLGNVSVPPTQPNPRPRVLPTAGGCAPRRSQPPRVFHWGLEGGIRSPILGGVLPLPVPWGQQMLCGALGRSGPNENQTPPAPTS